jgi:hypothetical protein
MLWLSLVVVDGCRTVVFRRYFVSRGRPAPLDQACQLLVVCFLRSIDDRPSGLVDVVALYVDGLPSGLVDVVFGVPWIRRSSKFSANVRSPILEECSLCSFIRCAVCRS